MYFHITAQPRNSEGDPIGKPLREHGVSLAQTMSLMANSMLDYLDAHNWVMEVRVDDPEPSSAAGRGVAALEEADRFNDMQRRALRAEAELQEKKNAQPLQ